MATKYFFPIAVGLMILLHFFLQSGLYKWVLLIAVIGLVFISVRKLFSWTQQSLQQSRRLLRKIRKWHATVDRLSEVEPHVLERVFRDEKTLDKKNKNEAKVFHLKPKLAKVQFQESEVAVVEIPYVPQHFLADFQKIEEEILKLPPENKKLVLFIADQKQYLEEEFLKSVQAKQKSEKARQRSVFHNTDVIEVSNQNFSKFHQDLIQIDQIYSNEYQHYLILYPSPPKNVIPIKSKPSPHLTLT